MEVFLVDKLDKSMPRYLEKELNERSKQFQISLEQDSDRATAIISACSLDNQLERILRAFYIKDRAINMIFKTDHILQSFFSKINIAYFSGLIPKTIYHDLKIVCEIRNKFAHEFTANLSFNSDAISKKINKCEIRPKTMDDIPDFRIKFVIIIQQLIFYLFNYEHLLLVNKPINLVELYKLDETPWEKITLTQEEMVAIIKKERARSTNK